MLCPKRKWIDRVDYQSEEFAPCIERECAAWRAKTVLIPGDPLVTGIPTYRYEIKGYCGLVGSEDLP